MEEVDFSKLPLGDRLVHSAWKARQSAYDESRRSFESSQSDLDLCFADLHTRPDTLRKWVLDPNVVAQETALGAIVKYLELGGSHQVVSKLLSVSFVSAVCEKGLPLSRKNTRDYANEIILLMVELAKDPGQVVEEILPSFQGRVPKSVAACVSSMALLVEQFGCGKLISPRLLVPVLPKLFAHADRNVRAEATRLATAMRVWMGPALDTVLFPELKPIQQKDLSKAFLLASLTDPPAQLRLTREQQQEQAQQQQKQQQQQHLGHSTDAIENVDVDMSVALADVDPYEFSDPVNVLSQIPPSFQTNMASAKWKDRKDALEEVRTILAKAKKMITSDDYSSLVRVLAKCMKDANLMVVQEASTCTELLVKGIGHAFTRYTSTIIGPMLERTKEKKASVATAILAALDAIFAAAGLAEVLEETLLAMRHKTPQIKIASTNYLQRCLAATKKPPSRAEVEQIMTVAVPVLSDSMEAVRQAVMELVGTLMQITGPRPLNIYLEKVDETRKTKISAFASLVVVNCKAGAPQPQAKQMPKLSSATPRLGASSPSNPSSVPSKRGAVSPAKRSLDASKMTSHGRGLASRSFASTPLFKPASPASVKSMSPSPPSIPSFSEEEKRELELLRLQKQQWLSADKIHTENEIRLQEKIRALLVEKAALTDQNHAIQRNYEMSAGMLKQRESQLENLGSELENARVKIRELELNIRKMQVDRDGAGMAQHSYKAPEPRVTSGQHELSSRVTQLALNSNHDNPFLNKPSLPAQASPSPIQHVPHPVSSPRLNFDNDNDSWRRAEEITSEMKARLETLKARSRATMSPVRKTDTVTRSIDQT